MDELTDVAQVKVVRYDSFNVGVHLLRGKDT